MTTGDGQQKRLIADRTHQNRNIGIREVIRLAGQFNGRNALEELVFFGGWDRSLAARSRHVDSGHAPVPLRLNNGQDEQLCIVIPSASRKCSGAKSGHHIPCLPLQQALSELPVSRQEQPVLRRNQCLRA